MGFKNVNSEHALLQKIVFADVLECKWQIFRSEELVRSQLLDAGFTEIEVFYDEAHIFPTVIAKGIETWCNLVHFGATRLNFSRQMTTFHFLQSSNSAMVMSCHLLWRLIR